MNISIKKVSHISPGQSVVCIIGRDAIPAAVKLSDGEKEYALRKIRGQNDHVYINTLSRFIYIIRLRDDLPYYRMIEDVRRKASEMKKLIKSDNHSELVITSDNSHKGVAEAFAEGFILGIYSFGKYKTGVDEKEKTRYPGKILLHGVKDKEAVERLTVLCEAVYMARDLINEPPNHLNATALAREIRKMGNSAGFMTEVLNKGRIEALRMGGLLAVNRGSVDPPVFCILEWRPEKKVNRKPVVLVGKGVMYDSGGLNIKTGDYMSQMKADMAGAATVAGVMYVMAKCRVPVHVIGLIPATDNRPGGNAYTQGDIITMYNGTTVEIGNTDAEGRLLLADAISYAGKYSPELIIDIATLTGTAAVTFGNQAIAALGNAPEKYFEALEDAGNEVYERVARLPFWEEYKYLLKSDIADIKSTGGREAGTITAGKFLETFTDHPFIHLDIAGTGILKKDDYYRIKEGPASGLRLLSAFLKRIADRQIKND